ncbi:MAG: reductive dehalogenase, partial [Desulfobacterales bacterium]|nr:reductive dehalogenase [Desulfobacterales bacterium]
RELPEPAYVKDIVEPIPRYSEKNTPLSRGYVPPGGWHQDFLETLVPVIGEQGPVPRDEPGYTQVDLAQRIAGFHSAMAANCHTGNWTRPRLSEKLGCFYDWEGPWSAANIGLPWAPEKMPVKDPARMTEIVQETGLFLGASLVGVTELNRNWVYKPGWDRYGHKEIDLESLIPASVKYAVVMAIETNYDFVRHAPTAKASAAAGLGYSKMAFLAPSMAKFIASLGYRAMACGNDTGLSVPIAVDAGLGQLGRFGAIITPEFGPRVRLCKVLTDLPLAPTAPIDFGVTEFCETCEKCAEYCPSQAILYGKRTHKARTPSTNPGLLKWPFDGEKCLRFWYRNGAKTEKGMYHIDCYQCINVCPFNKKAGMAHDLVRWFVRRKSPWIDRALVTGDNLFYQPLHATGKHAREAEKKG